VTGVDADGLTPARDAVARHDWEACLDHVAELEVDDPLAEAERLDLQAEALWWLGRLDDCIDAREAAYRAYEDLGRAAEAGQCAVWLYEHHGMRVRPAIATAWLRRARRVLEDAPPSVALGALLLREAEMAHGGNRLAEAVELAEEARRLGRQLGSTDIEAEALQTIGRIYIDDGRPAEGFANLDEAMLLAVEGRLGPYSTGKVYCSLISACEELGDLRRAAEWTEATATWAKRHPFAIFPGICRVHRAVILDRRGALADAEREASLACEELLGSHLPNAVAAFTEVGDIRRRLGDLPGAAAAFARAEELCGRTCHGAALLRLAEGRIDEARRIISGCLVEQPPGRLARAQLLLAAVQIAVAAGDLPTAASCVEELESVATTFDSAMVHATAALARGRLALASHDPAAAVVALRDAAQRWQSLDVPYEVATSKPVLAQALRDAGDEEAARATFAAARALFDQLGAAVASDGDGFGAPAAAPAGLTAREVEVLRLIAAGQSNKEIASALHLSAKTVSRHLSNIFTKIGVSSRSAATAFAFQHDLA
jgi:ATP/maltotriose-dependent transcriptional regulator MalT